jgi:hypothetical protein
MKQLNDKILAERLLQARASGGYKFLPFLRMNVKGYTIIVLYFGAVLAGLAYAGIWSGFTAAAGVIVGVFLRDVSWLTGIQRSWPFSVKVTDWDKVQKIADEKPLA